MYCNHQRLRPLGHRTLYHIRMKLLLPMLTTITSIKPSIRIIWYCTYQSLQDTLIRIKDWMDSLVLKMNEDKTEWIQFGSNKQLTKCLCDTISGNSSTISRSRYIKFLGSYLDTTLSFKKHVQIKCGTASKYVQYIASIRHFIPQDNTNQLVCSIVMSHLDFHNAIIIGMNRVTLESYQKVPNWAANFTLCRRRQDSSMQALFDLHWLPVIYCTDVKIGCLVLRALHN